MARALREQIRSGHLAPGAAVPSTRQVTREWGVAMATASRALAALRDEGLVRPVRGVGTVVVDRSAADEGSGRRLVGGRGQEVPGCVPASTRPPSLSARTGSGEGLSTEAVVVAAVRIADAEGLAALSMRRVAASLGVAAMSLYRHVGDKEDLQRRMLEHVLAGLPAPTGASAGWRAPVELACREMWARYRRHPWVASLISLSRPQLLPSAMVYSEHLFLGLRELGLGPAERLDAQIVLLTFAWGMASTLELEQRAEADTGLTADEWVDAHLPDPQAALVEQDLPVTAQTLQALTREGYTLDVDALFQRGLDALLDGIERRAEAHPGTVPGRE